MLRPAERRGLLRARLCLSSALQKQFVGASARLLRARAARLARPGRAAIGVRQPRGLAGLGRRLVRRPAERRGLRRISSKGK